MKNARKVLAATFAVVCLIAAWQMVLVCPLSAHDGDDHDHAVPKVSDEVAWAPTAIPDRIILSWTGDPSTTQTVNWRTDTTVKKAIADVAVAEDGPFFVEKARRVDAELTPLESDLGPAHYHTAVFTDLKPKTKYVYRVGDGTNWSEWSHFNTASRDAEPFTFIYMGDAQTELKEHWSRVIREAYSDAPKTAFTLHAGDLVDKRELDAEWGEWFYAAGFINRRVPCIAVTGNHEYVKIKNEEGDTVGGRLSDHWRPSFAFPHNGPAELDETVYWLDYQGVRFVALNTNEKIEQQAKWLEAVLADNDNHWTVVTFHHPIYSSQVGRDNPELRDAWQPLFDKYKVDIVLQGHEHTYARTRLMSYENVAVGVTKRSPAAGTMYTVSVSGPKMRELDRKPFVERAAEDTQLYQIITIDGEELRYDARTATGVLYDAFTLRKRPGQVNELIERVPDTPERRHEAKAAETAAK
jgi:predicted phosphodiesterase